MENIKKNLLFNASCVASVVTALTFDTRAGMIGTMIILTQILTIAFLFLYFRQRNKRLADRKTINNS